MRSSDLIFTSFFGLGLFMVSLSPTSVNIQTIVLGNILAISPGDTLQLLIISVVTLLVLTLKWQDFMVAFFDENHGRSIGLNPDILKVVFFTLLAASTVAALQTVGAFLVIAMVVTPGATAYLLTDRFPSLIRIAVAIGAISSFLGAYLSYHLNAATGGIIVLLQTGLFLLAFFFAPKHGMFATRRLAPQAGARSMMETLFQPFQFGFMQQAFIMAVVIAVPAALLSCFLVLKGWALMGDAISHAVLPGIVLAYIIGVPLAVGAFVAGMICALSTGFLKDNSRLREDTVMGVVFAGMFGLGLVMYTTIQTDVHLDHILFGNILGISWMDVLETCIIAVLVTGFILIKRKDLLLHAFDEQQARAIGLPVRFLHYGSVEPACPDNCGSPEGSGHYSGYCAC